MKAGDPVKLMLDGGTLDCGGIKIEADATLILLDSGSGKVMTGSTSSGVTNYGTFVMTGGEISGGKNGVANYGTFKMSGTAKAMGVEQYGVHNIGKESVFTMDGGSVTNQGTTAYDLGVKNEGTFTMNGGVVSGYYGVTNEGTFTMNGGTVQGTGSHGVDNSGTFTMHGGTVQAVGSGGSGVSGGTFTMNGGLVKGKISGVDASGPFRISAGTIEAANGKAVAKALEENSILPGSRKVSGGFAQLSVVVERIPAAPDLPQTGDASMLGAWAALLGASAMGLKLRKRR